MPVARTTNLLMVGTRKGAFIFHSVDGRRTWKMTGPHFKGTPIYHVVYDRRNRLMLATVDSDIWGPTVARSFDLGRSWKESRSPPRFPKESDWTVERLWHIEPSIDDEPDVIYCGTAPAALFRSGDRGESWTLNGALYHHKTRAKWQPGAGGLCLHTILVDPRDPSTILLAISAVGVVKTTDGGATWGFRNDNLLADFSPTKYPEYGQCIHKLARSPIRPDVIYQQNHCGVYRSDDNGDTWTDIRNNLPSRFGFPIAADSNDADRVYVAPEESPDARLPIDGRFLVWASDDAGREWSSLGAGLPRRSYYTVLREGLTTDREEPCGVYVGTSTGQLFGSMNGGRRWRLITDGLPPILSVSTG